MNLTTPPPAKLSDLIDLAIADARKLDHGRYTPVWMTWHRPRPLDGKCMVCLAGAVIAGTLACPADTRVRINTGSALSLEGNDSGDPPELITITDEHWHGAMRALDSAREGDWLEAFHALHGEYPEHGLHDAVEALPRPAEGEFRSWNGLEAHLVSLTACASRLRRLGL